MPELRYRFQAINAEDVIRSLASINAEMRAGATLSKDYARSVGGVGRSGRGGRAGDANEHVRAFERAEREKTKIVERETRRRFQTEDRNRRYLERVKTSSMLKEQRDQERMARARLREHAQHVREQTRIREAGIREQSKISSLVGGIGTGLVLGAGAVAAAGATRAGGAAIRKRLSLEETATRLAINSRAKGQRAVSAGELMAEADRTAKGVRGSRAEDVLSAQLAYVTKTGNLEEARRFAKSMTVASIATGADAADIGATAGAIKNKFGIETEADMQRVLSTMTFQGKAAEFEMADMATYFNEMAAAGGRFGLDKGAGGVQMLGTLAQIARMSTGTGAEASTGVQAMFRQLIAKGADGGKEGIAALTGGKMVGGKYVGGAEVFTDASRTKARDIQTVLKDVIAGTGGDLGKLQKIFGDEGMKGAAQFIKTYNEAQNKLGPGATAADRKAAGVKAIDDLFAQSNQSTNWGELEKDANLAGNTGQSKLTTLGETLMAELGNALAPAVAALTKHMGLLTGPIQSAGKNLTLLSEAFADVVGTLVSLGLIDKKSGPTETGAAALAKMAKNDKELKDLADKEAVFGLTTEQGYRKSELMSQNVELAQNAAQGTDLVNKYNQYKNLVDVTNAAPWMAGAKPVQAMDFAQFVRGTDQYGAAGMRNDILGDGGGLENKYKDARNDWSTFSTVTSTLGGPAAAGTNALLDLGAIGLDAANGKGFAGQGSAGEGVAKIVAEALSKSAADQQAAAQALTSAAKQMAAVGTPGNGAP